MTNRVLQSKRTRRNFLVTARGRSTQCSIGKCHYYVLILALLLNGKFLIGTVNCNISIAEEYNDSSKQPYDSTNTTTTGIVDSETELTNNINDTGNNDTLNDANIAINVQVKNITDSSETVTNIETDAPLRGNISEVSIEESETNISLISDDDYTYDVSFIPPTEIEMNDIESYHDGNNNHDHQIRSPQPKLSSNVIEDEAITTTEEVEHHKNVIDDYDEGKDNAIENATVVLTPDKEETDASNHNITLGTSDKLDLVDPHQQDNVEEDTNDHQEMLNQPISEPESKESKQRHPEPPSEVGMPTSMNITTNVTLENENDDNIEIDPSINIPDNHNVTQLPTPSLIDDNTISNKNAQQYHCGYIWGDMNMTRRRRPGTNLTILQQLFVGEIILSDNLDTIDKTRYQNITKKHIIDGDDNNMDHVSSPHEKSPKSMKSQEKPQQSTKPLLDDDEDDSDTFLSDLDESNELFEDVDLPDEFDVGTNNASIQEVIMGSATRVVIQRFTIVGRYIFRKARATQKLLFRHTKKAIGNMKFVQKLSEHFEDWNIWNWLTSKIEFNEINLLQSMYNDDGEYAPFRSLRNTNGEWILLQKLRNDDGDLFGISQVQIHDTTEWVQRHLMNIATNVNKFFDKIFTGSEMDDDELDFKFLSDENFAKQNFDPTI
jgi:hypothetical protein